MHALAAFFVAAALSPPVHVAVRPVEAGRDARVHVTVTGAAASARLQARLHGAQTPSGKATGWVDLARSGSSRRGTLRTPHYWGVYPIELRTAPGATPISRADWLVKVLPPGFHGRPSFGTPAEVAAWWVRTTPPRAVLVSAKPWQVPPGMPTNGFNRTLVVTFRLLVPWPPVYPTTATLTMFVTVSRESMGGRWRFVDVGTGP